MHSKQICASGNATESSFNRKQEECGGNSRNGLSLGKCKDSSLEILKIHLIWETIRCLVVFPICMDVIRVSRP